MLARFQFRNNHSLKRLDLMFVLVVILGIAWLAFIKMVPLRAANPDQMVVFTARWCASCATLVPGVQEVTKKLSIPFTLIDVDSPSAPTQASKFGLDIPRENLPQGYYVRDGAPSLVLNGKLYHAGQAAKARQDVEGSLIQHR
jgi:thiol-disulfide isomerase/thioredoxin